MTLFDEIRSKQSDQLCKCGCGEYTLFRYTTRDGKLYRHQANKFLIDHYHNRKSKSENYMKVSIKNGKTKSIHRIVMEQHLGRELNSDEHVHHIDSNRHNNELSNLQLMTRSEHIGFHHLGINR